MKLKLAFGIASAALLFAGCGENSVTNINDEAKDKGRITLKVVDSNTGVAIDSAEVYSLINGKIGFTDSTGASVWKKNEIGNYEYTVSKDGYATRTATVDIVEASGGDMARVEDRIVEVKMFKTGVSVKGTVLLADPQTGNLSAASKVSVILTYTDSFIVPQEVVTMTDTSGVYMFDNLAEGLTYTVSVPQVSAKSHTYAYDGSKNIEAALRSGEQKTLDQITMNIVGLTPELINDNLKAVNVSDEVRLSFSVPLNKDSVATSWKVGKAGFSGLTGSFCEDVTSVLTVASLDEDGKTVVIKPVSGVWTKLATYCISGTAYTEEGNATDLSKSFVPGSAMSKPANVTKLAASAYYSNYIQLDWTFPETEISGYRVFYKTNASADYVEYTNWHSGMLPTDSVKCRATPDEYLNSDKCIKEQVNGDFDRYDDNYYWYTAFKKDSTFSDSLRIYGGYNDSTSVINYWYTKYDTTKVTSLDEYSFTTRTYYWTTQKDTVVCELSYDDDSSSLQTSSYRYRDCEAYLELETSPSLSSSIGEDDVYYRYTWYTTKALAKNDTCEISSSYTYSSCPQYSKYGTTPYSTSGTYNYYKRFASDSSACVTSNTSYAYENCEQYTATLSSPNKRVNVYWNITPTDSTGCTVRGGAALSTSKVCEKLELTYEHSYNSKDNTYFWYTKKANIKPISIDTQAFVYVDDILGYDALDVNFIVLPYAIVAGDTIDAPVEKATASNKYSIAVEEEK